MSKIAVYRSLISYLVPELQALMILKSITAKSADTKQGNQRKLIKSVTSHTLLVDLIIE